MFVASSLQLFHELGTCKKYGAGRHPDQFKRPVIRTSKLHLLKHGLFSHALHDDSWTLHLSDIVHRPSRCCPSRNDVSICRAFLTPVQPNDTPILKAASSALTRLMKHAQKFFRETDDSTDGRNMGFQFAGKALYTAVWIAAASLFMELLGFSTQRWITAGGLGTLLLTLAGREIFSNFLSSAMIHVTRPFVVNEWIQTKIDSYEVSGMVEHVGWWSPTIIRGEDREAVHIPNHKFTVNVIRNHSQKTHWRIKTHLAVSHMNVNKIHNIVSDMRKVLAKNPHVEQQRLHRRVFLEDISPENQALLILVSCFVKTPRMEEYLHVKEAILLDLLRVINHHNARLATPIRTIIKMYVDADVENFDYGATIFDHGKATIHCPLLLIQHPSGANGEYKSKAHSLLENEEQDVGEAVAQDSKVMSSVSDVSVQNGPSGKLLKEAHPRGASVEQGLAEGNLSSFPPSTPTKPLEDSDSTSRKTAAPPTASHAKNEQERRTAAPPLITGASLEDNIVLGVALEGAKRTLPIEEGMGGNLNPAEVAKEMTIYKSGNGSKDNKRK